MALGLVLAILWGGVVWALAPGWGAPAGGHDRLVAAGLTIVAGTGVVLVTGREAVMATLLIGVLAVVAVVDARHQIIPNRLVAAAGVWAVANRVSGGQWVDAILLGIAIFLFYLMVHVVTHGGLGMGDVKLAGVLGFALGYPAGLLSMVAGIWAAGLYAVFMLVKGGQNRRAAMALGPFLAFGGLVGLLDFLH